ncbi:MAG TPA: glutamine synthetase [Desulfobacterales bacterium]|nr:glutamine synthetase [Desulfobacterales bacterium]
MKDTQIAMNPNPIVQYLGKSPEEFTKEDLIKFIEENKIEMVNFRYVGGDGRLKTLNFVITSKAQLDQLLSRGERVDGSSLFSYIDAASSDLYVIPRYKTAYVNPFSPIPTVDILCSYYTSEGVRLPSSPENIVRKAHEVLKESTGLSFEAMGELEYYVLCGRQHLYPVMAQKGYQESSPFFKWEKLRCEAMQAIAQAGGKMKYGHSEVGSICEGDYEMEQHEIEFSPVPIEDAADQIVIAKWILRMIGYKYGVTISFAPKISVGHAGSGLHIHTKLVKDGKNMMVEGNGLSDVARKAIAGYLSLAPSLTAFGNTVPISYLRLVPHQEAPTNVCWGDRNRSVLVRVPLEWLGVKNMIRDANPQEKGELSEFTDSQTVEFRCPDGSADIYLLLAGLAVAARHGLEMEDALELANKLYVDVNIFSPEHKKVQERLPQLPTSCWESAESLLKDRKIYERDGVFPPIVIEGIAKKLKSYDDRDLRKRLQGKEEEIKKLVNEYLHCS